MRLSWVGEDGDRLPSSPEYTYHIGLNYDLELMGYPSYIAGDYARVGGFYNKLGEEGLKTGDYGQVNLLCRYVNRCFESRAFRAKSDE